MKVKELKEILNNQDDDLEVAICEGDEYWPLSFADEVILGGACDEQGNPIDDGQPDEIKLFVIASISQSFDEEEAPELESKTRE